MDALVAYLEQIDANEVSAPLPNPPLAIVTATMADAWVGTGYGKQLVSNGGTGPYTWSLISGSLPPGLSLNGNGAISGNVGNSVGVHNFTVQVTDLTSATATQALAIRVKKISKCYSCHAASGF
jgi:hypothetical protein